MTELHFLPFSENFPNILAHNRFGGNHSMSLPLSILCSNSLWIVFRPYRDSLEDTCYHKKLTLVLESEYLDLKLSSATY